MKSSRKIEITIAAIIILPIIGLIVIATTPPVTWFIATIYILTAIGIAFDIVLFAILAVNAFKHPWH